MAARKHVPPTSPGFFTLTPPAVRDTVTEPTPVSVRTRRKELPPEIVPPHPDASGNRPAPTQPGRNPVLPPIDLESRFPPWVDPKITFAQMVASFDPGTAPEPHRTWPVPDVEEQLKGLYVAAAIQTPTWLTAGLIRNAAWTIVRLLKRIDELEGKNT